MTKGYGPVVLSMPDGRAEPIFVPYEGFIGGPAGSLGGPMGVPKFNQDPKTSLGTSRDGLKSFEAFIWHK